MTDDITLYKQSSQEFLIQQRACISYTSINVRSFYMMSVFLFTICQAFFVWKPRNATTAWLRLKINFFELQKKKVMAPKFQLVVVLQFSDFGGCKLSDTSTSHINTVTSVHSALLFTPYLLKAPTKCMSEFCTLTSMFRHTSSGGAVRNF